MFAHRGGSALAPENTCAAFDNGLALGADGLELDVHLSRDGIVVVHHDPTLDRTTNLTGAIVERTADELARADAGCRFRRGDAAPFAGQGVGVPTLADVLGRYFEPGFYVEHFIKDMDIALKEAERMNLCLPGLGLAKQLYEAVRAQGFMRPHRRHSPQGVEGGESRSEGRASCDLVKDESTHASPSEKQARDSGKLGACGCGVRAYARRFAAFRRHGPSRRPRRSSVDGGRGRGRPATAGMGRRWPDYRSTGPDRSSRA